MSRYAGRRGQIYLGIASDSATAEPLPFVAKWSLSMENEKIDVTTMDDDNMVYVGGMSNASGEWSGFHDDSTAQSYTAAGDGLARKFYLYPNRTAPTKYFFGTVICDMTIDSEVNGAVNMSANWTAASKISKVPA
jgi:hypothetical protein